MPDRLEMILDYEGKEEDWKRMIGQKHTLRKEIKDGSVPVIQSFRGCVTEP